MIELAVAVGAVAAPLFAALRRLKPCGHRDWPGMRMCTSHGVHVPPPGAYPDEAPHVLTNDEHLARYELDFLA